MILIDYRTGSKDLVGDGHLPPDVAQIADLGSPGPDAAFLGYGPGGPHTYPIAVEIKALSARSQDAWTSWRTGRLTGGQLPQFAQDYKRVYLIVEGVWRPGPQGEIEIPEWTNERSYSGHKWRPLAHAPDYRTFDNFLNSLTEIGRIIVKRTADRTETARAILDLYLWWSKDYEAHQSLLTFDRSQEPTQLVRPTFKRRVAAELESIGWQKSEAIAKTFSSIHALANASVTDLMAIPGIGAKLAAQIWCELRGLKEIPDELKQQKSPAKKRARKEPGLST